MLYQNQTSFPHLFHKHFNDKAYQTKDAAVKRIPLLLQLSLIVPLLCFFCNSVHAAEPHTQPPILQSASELDYPPFAIVQADGTADGFSVELLQAVADAADIKVNISVGPWHEIKEKLAQGRLDVLPLVAYSPDRDKVFDFTVPYLQMHGAIFVRKGENSIRTEADLKGREVLVMRDDSAHEYAVNRKLQAKLILTDTFGEAMKLLSSGKHDAVLCQYLMGLQLIKQLGITNIVSVSANSQEDLKPRSMKLSNFDQQFCFAVQEGDKELLALLNYGLAIVFADGTYENLYHKWFAPILPQPPVSLATVIKYVLSILLPLLFFMAFAGIWYLNREVQKRTRKLRAEIEERKQVEKELRDGKATLQRAQGAARVGSWWYDPVTRQPRWTDEMFHVFGMAPQPEAPHYDEHKNIIHPEDRDAFDAAVTTALTKGIGYNLELRVIYPNGAMGWVNSICQPVKDNQGKVTELIGTTQDITARKEAEKQKALLQKRLEALWKISSLQDVDLTTIYDNILHEIVAMTDSQYGFYGFLNDAENEMNIFSWSNSAMRDCAMHAKPLVFAIEKSGIWSNAVRNRKPFILNDYKESCENKKGIPEGHVALTRVLSIPVITSGKIVAVGAVANKKEPYDEDDVRQLESFLANAQIIISRKNAEEKLKISERILKKSQEIAQLGSWHLDIKNNILTWSEEEYRIFGKSPQEFGATYEAFLDAVHPEDRERLDKTYTRAIQNHLPYECIHRIIKPDGEVRVVLEKSEDIVDEKGETIHSFGFTQDITELKKAESALRESEKKFRNLLESTSTVPWELDLGSGKFTYMGKQIEQVLGYPTESWVDLDCWKDRLHPEDRDEAVQFCETETKKGNDHDFTYRAIHMDGSYRWIRDIVSVVTDDAGAKRLVGFMHDITEQKKLSLEYKTLEEQWQQLQKMEAIGTLAGGIAHDFNNILGTILGYADMAKEDAPQGTQFQKDIDKILLAANKAKDLVKQILAFSRKTEIERIPMKLQPLIKEGLKMLRSSIPTTISIMENIDPKCGSILADPTQIHQVLMNLCTNAAHAMEKTGGALSISLKTTAIGPDDQKMQLHIPLGEYVELTVADTGIGIAPDAIGKIFDPYFTTKEIGKGTGMGLAIIHGIISEYGGAVTVESQLGEGATFHVYFPVITMEALSEVKEPENILKGNERILLVDDEAILAEMGKNMLERLGYRVTAKSSSLEALETFQHAPDQFDLVITDQTMPWMTGSELAERIMRIKPDIPIILCTGFSTLINENSAKALGIKEFALKPLTKSTISKLIRKVLDAS
ncbi:MAG: PAS domain-containing protein [Desulfobulbaceae bacterium]|nr:PAS domain-containing protein [Desulfobulbaceae bacterium]